MQVTLNIKDANYTKALDAIAQATGWTQDITTDGLTTANPITKEANFKKWLKAKIRNEIIEQANRQAIASVIVGEDL